MLSPCTSLFLLYLSLASCSTPILCSFITILSLHLTLCLSLNLSLSIGFICVGKKKMPCQLTLQKLIWPILHRPSRTDSELDSQWWSTEQWRNSGDSTQQDSADHPQGEAEPLRPLHLPYRERRWLSPVHLWRHSEEWVATFLSVFIVLFLFSVLNLTFQFEIFFFILCTPDTFSFLFCL